MPFTLCDVEGYPTNQPASTEPGKLVKGHLERVGAPRGTSLRRAAPTVSYSNRNPIPIPSPDPIPTSEPNTKPGPSPSPIPSPVPLPNPNQVSFIGGALYFVEVAPPALGAWALTLFLRDEQLGPTVNVTAG